jgi:hypothetical protein
MRFIPEPESRFNQESFRSAYNSERSRRIRSNLNRLQTQRRRAMHNAKVRDATTYS